MKAKILPERTLVFGISYQVIVRDRKYKNFHLIKHVRRKKNYRPPYDLARQLVLMSFSLTSFNGLSLNQGYLKEEGFTII